MTASPSRHTTSPSPTASLIKDGHPQYRTNLQGVKRVDILNRHRIRFVFEQPNNPLLIMRLGELPVLPQHYWKNRDFGPPPSSRRWAAVPTASRRCNPGARWCSNACATGGGEAAGQPGQVQLQPRRSRVLPRQRGGVQRSRSVNSISTSSTRPRTGPTAINSRPCCGRHHPRGDSASDSDPDPGAVHERTPRDVRRPARARGPRPDVRFRVDQPRTVLWRLSPQRKLLPQQRVQRHRQA